MNRLLRVRPMGMFSYGEVDWVDLDNQGIVELIGINHDRDDSSNGSGKSSLINAITTLGWGKNSLDCDADDVVNKVWNRGCLGSLEFIAPADQRRCRVTHARHWKTKTTQLDPALSERSEIAESGNSYSGTSIILEEWDSGEGIWRDRREKSMPLTQAKCVSWLGMDYAMFCSIAHIGQGQVLRFMATSKADEREAIISELLRLKVFATASEIARGKSTDLKKRIEIPRAVIAEKDAFLRSLAVLTPDKEMELKAYISDRGNDISIVDTQIAELEQKIVEVSSQLAADPVELRQRIGMLSLEVQNVGAQAARLNQEGSSIRWAAETQKREITSRADAELQQLQSQEAVLVHEVDRLGKNALSLNQLGGACQVCGSTLTVEHMASERARRQQMVDEATAKLQAVRTGYAARKASHDSERQHQLEQITSNLNTQLANLDIQRVAFEDHARKLTVEIAGLQAQEVEFSRQKSVQAAAVPALRLQINQLRGTREQHLTSQHIAQERLSAHERNQQLVADIAKKITDEKALLLKLEDEQKYYQFWHVHMDNLKMRKIASAIGALNDQLKELLEVVTDGDIEAWISPYRVRAEAKKKDPRVLVPSDYIFEPELVIREGAKVGVPSYMYSGGESGLVMLCLIFAFRALAVRNGVGCNLVILDEAFSRYDPKNAASVVEFFKYMKGKVPTIIVVAHEQHVKGLLEIDHLWQAEKSNHISRLNVQ